MCINSAKQVYTSVIFLSRSRQVSILLLQSEIILSECSQFRKDAGILSIKISFYLPDMVLQWLLFHDYFSPRMCVCSIEG